MTRQWFRIASFIAAMAGSIAVAGPVDINSASSDQLAEAMVGVGKSKADAIVQDRDKNGKFKNVDELSRVKGIKSSTIDKNRDKITVGQADVPPPADPAKK